MLFSAILILFAFHSLGNSEFPTLIEDEMCYHEMPFIFHSFTDSECTGDLDLVPSDGGKRREGSILSLDNCTDTNEKVCLNQGTWKGEFFHCECQRPEENGYCFFKGASYHYLTCNPRTLGTSEIWLNPQSSTGEEVDNVDWEFQLLNLFLFGSPEIKSRRETSEMSMTGDIGIIYSEFDYEIFEDVYEYSPDQTLLHIVLTTDISAENCNNTHLKIYINNKTVVDVPNFSWLSYYYTATEESVNTLSFSYHNHPYEFLSETTITEKVFMISSFECVADSTQVGLLYEMGPNRSANFTLECCKTLMVEDELVEVPIDSTPLSTTEEDLMSKVWKVIFWISVSIFGVCIAIISLAIAIYLYWRSTERK